MLAGDRRDAMRLRTRRIRRSVAALAAVLFSTAFLVIYVQLASGHDPALVANAKRAAAAAADTSTSSTSTSANADEGSSSEREADAGTTATEGSSSSSRPSSGAAAVTTSQS
jgi:hypothetical protein